MCCPFFQPCLDFCCCGEDDGAVFVFVGLVDDSADGIEWGNAMRRATGFVVRFDTRIQHEDDGLRFAVGPSACFECGDKEFVLKFGEVFHGFTTFWIVLNRES